MIDLISRQAAINEMKIRQHSAYEWYVTAKSKDDEEIMIRADSALASFIECILTIKKLPSAQPNLQPTCNQLATDYISRQAAVNALIAELNEKAETYWDNGLNQYDVESVLNALPSADVAPVRHGRWIPKFNGAFSGGAYWYDCSECGHTVTGGNLSGKHFCENCGARMDGEKNG